MTSPIDDQNPMGQAPTGAPEPTQDEPAGMPPVAEPTTEVPGAPTETPAGMVEEKPEEGVGGSGPTMPPTPTA